MTAIVQHEAETQMTKQTAISDAVDQTREQEYRRWLSPPDPSTNHHITLTTHHKGTTAWFLEGNVFSKWKSTPSFLWINGKPGSGKTILCSSIIEQVKAFRNSGLTYFYFDFRDENKQSRDNLLRSLLFQLSTQYHHLSDILSHLHSLYEDGNRRPSDVTLARCLKKMLSHPNQDPVYLIIDGVDECPNTPESGMPSPREQVLKLIEELAGFHLPNLHLCVTSRPEVGIHMTLKELITFSVSLHEQNGHKEDIVDYINSVVYSDPKMGSWSEKDKKLVVETLSKRNDGVFRLACCQLESLRHPFSPDLRSVLRGLPETLDQAYEQVLNSIDKANLEHAHRLLQCLTVAIRPLRVEELAQVLAVDFDADGRPGIPRANSAMDQQAMPVLSACSSLISIDSRVVQFSHFSVKEFLTSKRLANSRGDVSRYHISLQSAHATLAQACLGVLLCLDGHSNVADFPLAQYAAKYWDVHVLFKGVSSRIQDTIERFLDGNKPHWRAWHGLCDADKCSSFYADYCPAPLFYAAFYGLYDIVGHLIEKHPQHMNPRVHAAGTPLNGALMGDQFDVAELLYTHGAKVNMQDGTKSTLLHVASQASDQVVPAIKILQWLLDRGADVHARDENDKTPLHLAAEKGPLNTIQMLIKHEANIEAQDKDGRTPLHIAVGRRSLDVVQTLIEHKANVNSRDKKGKTALHLAVHSRHFDIVRMLIDNVTNVNERDEEGNTPLHVAANQEHPDIARMLLKCKANVNAGNNSGKTPLHVAVHRGRLDVARMLIKYNANVNAKNNKGQTPLHLAVYRYQLDIVQMLLEHNADISVPDSLGRVALHLALDGGKTGSRLNITLMLLDHIEAANARHGTSTSCLSWLSALFTQRPFKHHANINAEDKSGRTALDIAFKKGDYKVVELLREYGAK